VFERYTERARRTIFFARDEALRRKASSIETSDLVLGLTRDKHQPDCPFSFLYDRAAEIRMLLGYPELAKSELMVRNVPLSDMSKRALAYATKEANRDSSYSIDADHLFRGVLLTGDTVAFRLESAGWTIEAARRDSKRTQTGQQNMRSHFFFIKVYRRRLFLCLAAIAFVAAIAYMHFQN
jgi:ATP-dependent Clp protease ATP-binding subunit ClpC